MRRFLAILAIGLALVITGLDDSAHAAAQIDQETEFEIRPLALKCPTGYPAGDATLESCTPWEGVVVTMTAEDGTSLGSCVIPCGIVVPRGSTTILSIDPAAIPPGYSLPGGPVQEFYAYDWPPNSPELQPVFYLNPIEDGDDGLPIPESPVDAPEMDETAQGEDGSEPMTATTTDAHDDEEVVSLPTTGTQPSASGERGMTGLLIAAASLMLAGAWRIRRAPMRSLDS